MDTISKSTRIIPWKEPRLLLRIPLCFILLKHFSCVILSELLNLAELQLPQLERLG